RTSPRRRTDKCTLRSGWLSGSLHSSSSSEISGRPGSRLLPPGVTDMYAPLWLAHRDGPYLGAGAAQGGPGLPGRKARVPVGRPGSVSDVLEPVDYRLLHLRFAGLTDEAIATDIGRPIAEVRERIHRPRFLQVQAEVEKGVLHRIMIQGEYEPVTL